MIAPKPPGRPGAAATAIAASKEPSQLLQKEMLAGYFSSLARAPAEGRKVVHTFVPGNLTELLHAFGVAPVYPEINALQSAMRKRSDGYVREAEKHGHSEDVCTYVKCDLGMALSGSSGPTSEIIPRPDLLLCSYTGCFTFMKWFELLRQQFDAPVAMLHVPYQADGKVTPEMVAYVVGQLRENVIPALETVTGKKYDEAALSAHLARSAQAEEDLVYALGAARNVPTPVDAYFGAVYYVGPIFSSFRGSEDCIRYYAALREEIDGRIERHEGPVTPDGPMGEQRYRLVVEGPPNWTHFREFWKLFADEGAVFVASTYTKVGGTYDLGFRHDPDRPLETLAEYCLGCYTNLNLPSRIDVLEKYVRDYQADGFVVHSVKSCNSFSVGQLLMLRELEKRTGRPGAFLESDLVDSRYFSRANLKNRVDSFLQMVEERRRAGAQA